MVSEKKIFLNLVISLWELHVDMATRVSIKSDQNPFAAFPLNDDALH